MKVCFLGTGDFVQPIKESLKKHFSLVESLKKADLAVIASYGQILSQKQLNTPKYGCINVHPSMLPKYRGPSPIQAAVLNGEKISGITIMKMDARVDHGPIIYQEQMDLSDSDNFQTLSKKMFQRATEILPQIIKNFTSGKVKLRVQDHAIASYCHLISKQDGYFEINNPPPAENLDRMIRAYYPWPTAWTRWRGKIVKFLPNNMLQMEGKKPVSLKDFLNGYPDFPVFDF